LGAAAGHWGLGRLNQGRVVFRDTTVVLYHGQQARLKGLQGELCTNLDDCMVFFQGL